MMTDWIDIGKVSHSAKGGSWCAIIVWYGSRGMPNYSERMFFTEYTDADPRFYGTVYVTGIDKRSVEK